MTVTLSDTQRAILTAAATTDDRLVRPDHVQLKGGAVRIVLQSLVRKSLLEELPADGGAHAWWDGEAGSVALRVTDEGCEAVGIAPSSAQPASAAAKAFRTRTKQAALIALLQRDEGATIQEMVAATGWLPHTVRGALAGALKKRLGIEIASEKVEERGRVYRASTPTG
jgi:hypothetical protein